MNPSSAPSASIPIRFFTGALGALGLLALWFVLRPDIIAGHHYRPETVAAVHLLILGFLLPTVMGSAYMIVPVALGVRLASERVARLQGWIYLAGVCLILPGFARWDMAAVWHAGALVLAGVLLFVGNIAATLGRVPRPDAAATFIATTLLWLLLTLALGLAAAIHKLHPFLPGIPTQWMYAHAHLGVIGVFLNLTVGVSLRLVPMFALTEVRGRARVWASFLLINLGVAWLSAAIAMEQPLFHGACASAIAIGFALYIVESEAMFRTRRRRHLDWGLTQFRVAIVLLLPASGLGLALSAPPDALPASMIPRLQTAYPLLGLLGVVAFAVLGMLHKILPFLVWYRAYSPHIGRRAVPTLADLTSPRLQAAGFFLHLLGVGAMLAGVLLAARPWIALGTALWAGAAIAFLGNAARVLRHWFAPAPPPLTPTAPRT